VPTDRATARAQVAERALTAIAAERVVRVALYDLPVSLVGRATTQLRRFFSGASWTAEDDAALAASVGPGTGWYEEELDPELTLGFGWRAGVFRTEVRYVPIEIDTGGRASGAPSSPASASLSASLSGPPAAPDRTLGDTFEDAVVLESGRRPTELYFRIGPTPEATATFTRDTAAGDARVGAAFRASPSLIQVSLASGTLTATIDDADNWRDELLPLFDAVAAEFAPTRAAPPDRQLERARSELGTLQADSPRDLARILDATTSPDAAFRRVAFERLEGAESVVALRAWTRGLEDSSRAVRRTTARELAKFALTETRALLERALGDTDACVRYYAFSGLVRIGLPAGAPAAERLRRDPDVRVRLAADAALEGVSLP
jgi:HEAT repeats